MNQRRRVAIVAAVATIMASAPLSALFRTFGWLLYVVTAVTVVAGVAIGCRALRSPLWVQLGAMLGALLLVLTWFFPSGAEIIRIVPTGGTLHHFQDLISTAAADVRQYAVPIPDRDGIFFITTLGLGLIAIAVDLLTIELRNPALAGLPMLAVYSVPVAIRPEELSLIPFMIGATGYLWLLVTDNIDRVRRWGRRFSDDGRDVDVWERSPLAAGGRRLGVIAIAVAAVVPLALPGMTSGFFERLVSGNGPGTGTGGAGFIDPIVALHGDLSRRDEVVYLRIRTSNPNPGYLRIAVADDITAEGAHPRPVSGHSLPDPSDGDIRFDSGNAAPPNTVDRRPSMATVTVYGLGQRTLPLYSRPTAIHLENRQEWNYDPATGVVWSETTTTEGLSYRFEYVTYDFTGEALRQAGPLDRESELFRRNTSVPASDYVRSLVEDLVADQPTQYDQVLAILNFFTPANGFEYSLTTAERTTTSAIEDFLQHRRGFCQQYAVAMTWMLRTAGIPARVAIGFTQGQRNGDQFTVTNFDAHAWVEVHFPGFGWVPFDPTPASGVNNAADWAWAPHTDPEQPDTPDATTTPSVSGGSAAPRDPARNDPDAYASSQAAAIDAPEQSTRWPYGLLLLIVGIGLMLPGLHRSLLRRARLQTSADPAQAGRGAHAAWDEVIDTMVDLRIPVNPAETPRASAARLTTGRAPLVESAQKEMWLLARAEERARYAQAPLAVEAGQLAQAVQRVREDLQRYTGWFTRARTVLFPPSVLQVWRERAASRLTVMTDTVQEWRDQLVQSLRRLRRRTDSSEKSQPRRSSTA